MAKGRKGAEPLPQKINTVTCGVWVAQGKAQSNPEKVEICSEDIEKLVQETRKVKLEGKSNNDTNTNTADDEDDEDWEDDEDVTMETDQEVKIEEEEEEKDEKSNDIDVTYGMATYDDEKEDQMGKLLGLSDLAVFVNPADDPILAAVSDDPTALAEREAEELSECENHNIKPNDNLIAMGHVDQEDSIPSFTLEVYVYNEEDDALYPHHDNLLPNAPLCMEWLNYDASVEGHAPGNLVAVGTMDPVIEVWNLDLIDGLEPAFQLPKASEVKKSKKKKKSASNNAPSNGHTDAVISIAWNKVYEHVLASGSADGSVILWDMEQQSVSKRVQCCTEGGVVHCLAWHPTDGTSLVVGTSQGIVQAIDCTQSSTDKRWQLDSPVEKVMWIATSIADKKKEANTCNILVSTDKGEVICLDPKKEKPMWTMKAHDSSCTGLQLSTSCPGLLVTACESGSLGVWDTMSGEQPTLIETLQPKVGRIHCLSAAVEQPFVFFISGDKVDNCFRVWDIRSSVKVRRTFCPRVGLSTDEGEDDAVHLEQDEDDDEEDDQDDDGQDKMTRALKQAMDEECRPRATAGGRVKDGRIAKPNRKM